MVITPVVTLAGTQAVLHVCERTNAVFEVTKTAIVIQNHS